ncbi:MAG: hypothetical protein ACFB0B_15980 [Thermonemataceae bacterium]
MISNLLANYEKILTILRKFLPENLIEVQRRCPKLSDLAVLSLSLTSEYMGIDSENHLFRLLPNCLSEKIERSVYNRRRRRLFTALASFRVQLASLLNEEEDCFLVDSMPLAICKEARRKGSRICKETYYSSPDKGYCPS